MIDVADKTHSLWQQLAKYKPEQIAGLVDRMFAKYNQPFELLSVDDVRHRVEVRLADGRQVNVQL